MIKVICPFCDSYISADENMNCPNCGGSVSAEVKQAEDDLRREEAERVQREEEWQRKQQESRQEERLFQVVIAALAAVFGGRHGRGFIRMIINAVMRGRR